VPPTAANDESRLSGSFAIKESLLRGLILRNTPESWQSVEWESFVWGGKNSGQEVWDVRPFILLMRPYLLSRLKNEAGSWEYIRYLAEANAVHSLTDPNLLKLLARPDEADYRIQKEEALAAKVVGTAEVAAPLGVTSIVSREQAFLAVRERDFEPAIRFWKHEVDQKPYYHSGWQRLGFAQREYGVDLMDTEREKSEQFLRESIVSFTKATSHSDSEYEAEAYYNRSKSHWRLWRLTEDRKELDSAVSDAQTAASRFYDHRFISWYEFLKENLPTDN
jgi:hypothetical protein